MNKTDSKFVDIGTTTSNLAHSLNQDTTTTYFSEYEPSGAILFKADNLGNEEWAGE